MQEINDEECALLNQPVTNFVLTQFDTFFLFVDFGNSIT